MGESVLVVRVIPLLLGGAFFALCFYLAGELGPQITKREKLTLGWAAWLGFSLLTDVVVDVFSLSGRTPLRLAGMGMFVVLAFITARMWWAERSGRNNTRR